MFIDSRSDLYTTQFNKGVDVFDVVVFRDQFSGSYFADALYTGNIVGCVAAEREDLHHLLGTLDAELRADLLDVDEFVVAS